MPVLVNQMLESTALAFAPGPELQAKPAVADANGHPPPLPLVNVHDHAGAIQG